MQLQVQDTKKVTKVVITTESGEEFEFDTPGGYFKYFMNYRKNEKGQDIEPFWDYEVRWTKQRT